jgi:hypothetical protein
MTGLTVLNAVLVAAIALVFLASTIMGRKNASLGRFVMADESAGDTAEVKMQNAVQSCGRERCLLLVSSQMPRGGINGPLPDNVLLVDLRQESLRIIRRGFPFISGDPQQFANEPNESTLLVADAVPAQSKHEQDQTIAGLIRNESTGVNAVAIWGGGEAVAKNSRVWGGFFNVSNGSQGPDGDAQLVALEVDTLNYGKPGIAPYNSKVGIQIAGLGTSPNTNAIEILTGAKAGVDKAPFMNGIVFVNDAVHADGTVIGIDGEGPYKSGLDFSRAVFRDSAMRIRRGQRIMFGGHGVNASLYATPENEEERLILQTGKEGLVILDSAGQKALLDIRPDGTIRLANGQVLGN